MKDARDRESTVGDENGGAGIYLYDSIARLRSPSSIYPSREIESSVIPNCSSYNWQRGNGLSASFFRSCEREREMRGGGVQLSSAGVRFILNRRYRRKTRERSSRCDFSRRHAETGHRRVIALEGDERTFADLRASVTPKVSHVFGKSLPRSFPTPLFLSLARISTGGFFFSSSTLRGIAGEAVGSRDRRDIEPPQYYLSQPFVAIVDNNNAGSCDNECGMGFSVPPLIFITFESSNLAPSLPHATTPKHCVGRRVSSLSGSYEVPFLRQVLHDLRKARVVSERVGGTLGEGGLLSSGCTRWIYVATYVDPRGSASRCQGRAGREHTGEQRDTCVCVSVCVYARERECVYMCVCVMCPYEACCVCVFCTFS